MGLLSMGTVPAVAATDISKLPVVTQELVAPPFVPKHDQVAKGGPKVVKIRMETIEKQVQIAPDGTKMWALTFNGTVPGPLIVVHQDDYVGEVAVDLWSGAESVVVYRLRFKTDVAPLTAAEYVLLAETARKQPLGHALQLAFETDAAFDFSASLQWWIRAAIVVALRTQ